MCFFFCFLVQNGGDTVWPHDPRTGWSYCITIPSWALLPKSKYSDPVVVLFNFHIFSVLSYRTKFFWSWRRVNFCESINFNVKNVLSVPTWVIYWSVLFLVVEEFCCCACLKLFQYLCNILEEQFYRVQISVQSPEGVTTMRGVFRRFNDFLKLLTDVRICSPLVSPYPTLSCFISLTICPFIFSF